MSEDRNCVLTICFQRRIEACDKQDSPEIGLRTLSYSSEYEDDWKNLHYYCSWDNVTSCEDSNIQFKKFEKSLILMF